MIRERSNDNDMAGNRNKSSQPLNFKANFTLPGATRRELKRVGLKYEEESRPNISVIIPAYNEEKRLATTLHETWQFLESYHPLYEIIVVDDGSKDGTASLVRQFSRLNQRVLLICAGRNQGKGAAVRLGMNNARGKYQIYIDADGSSKIEHMDKLFRAIEDGADVAIGSRISKNNEDIEVKRHWCRHLIGQTFNFLVRSLIIADFKDTQCGFKMFKRHVSKIIFSTQKIDGFAFDVEILYLCCKLKLRVKEIPIDWTHKPGSKINIIKDSLRILYDLNRMCFLHMFSTAKQRALYESTNYDMIPEHNVSGRLNN